MHPALAGVKCKLKNADDKTHKKSMQIEKLQINTHQPTCLADVYGRRINT
jgi:hypothetical protein